MMQYTALILSCAYAASAYNQPFHSNPRPLPPAHYPKIKWPSLSEAPKYPGYSGYNPMIPGPRPWGPVVEPYEPKSNGKNQWDAQNRPAIVEPYEHIHQKPWDTENEQTDSNFEEDTTPTNAPPDNEVEPESSETSLQNPPKAWNAPAIRQALKDFDEGIDRMMSHFTREALADKDDKNFRYVVIVHVVNQLSKEVSENGWQSYNTNYTSQVKQYIDQALMIPDKSVAMLDCEVLKPAEEIIRKVRDVIRHPAIQFVCIAQPSSCDTVIWTVFEMDPSPDTKRAIEVLLASGYAAATFLKSYAAAFEAISTQNVYQYLFTAHEELRALVAADADVRSLIGEQTCLGD